MLALMTRMIRVTVCVRGQVLLLTVHARSTVRVVAQSSAHAYWRPRGRLVRVVVGQSVSIAASRRHVIAGSHSSFALIKMLI